MPFRHCVGYDEVSPGRLARSDGRPWFPLPRWGITVAISAYWELKNPVKESFLVALAVTFSSSISLCPGVFFSLCICLPQFSLCSLVSGLRMGWFLTWLITQTDFTNLLCYSWYVCLICYDCSLDYLVFGDQLFFCSIHNNSFNVKNQCYKCYTCLKHGGGWGISGGSCWSTKNKKGNSSQFSWMLQTESCHFTWKRELWCYLSIL